MISDKTVAYLCVLTRKHDVEPELAHGIRVAAHRGRMTPEQADAAIAMLKELPGREGAR